MWFWVQQMDELSAVCFTRHAILLYIIYILYYIFYFGNIYLKRKQENFNVD